MSDKAIAIYNYTNEVVKVCVKDSGNREMDSIIPAREIWVKRDTEGCNTVIIIPLNQNQNTFYFTMYNPHSLIIQRKCGKLILVPSRKAPQAEKDTTLRGHIRHGISVDQNAGIYCSLCSIAGCLVFNDTNEPVWICVSDCNDRNTHVVLDCGDNCIVETPRQKFSILKEMFTLSSTFKVTASNALEIKVAVVEANPPNSANFIRKATYPTKSYFHESKCSTCTFLRVLKKEGYFMIEQDTIELGSVINFSNIPLSYLLTKDCCQKLRTLTNADIIKIDENKYDVVSVEYNASCCIQ